MQLNESSVNTLAEECEALLAKAKVSEEGAKDYIDTVTSILRDYQSLLSPDAELSYRVRKVLGRVELVLIIPGDRLDPFEVGDAAQERSERRKLTTLVHANQKTSVGYLYQGGRNVITVRSAGAADRGGILKQPMVIAVIIGILLGLVCQRLPENTATFIREGVASPTLKAVLAILNGAMGPYVFLSLVAAINTLTDVDELSSLGSKLFKRFVIVAIFLTMVAVGVSALLFPVFGGSDVSFNPYLIVELLLGIVPPDIITPFVENNVPQLVVLGICMGEALLLMGNGVEPLVSIIVQLRDWLDEFMVILLKLAPLVPLLSVFGLVAEGGGGEMIMGWRYVIGVYLGVTICGIIKFAKVATRCKVGVLTLWRKVKPAMMLAFTSGSGAMAFKELEKIEREQMGVSTRFSSFWYPLSEAMLSPATTLIYTIAPFFIAYLTGMRISTGFLLIVIILSVELSVASPGFTAGLTVMLASLGMSTDYVGLFSAYGIFTKNVACAFNTAYGALEQVEASYTLDQIDVDRLRAPATTDTSQQ